MNKTMIMVLTLLVFGSMAHGESISLLNQKGSYVSLGDVKLANWTPSVVSQGGYYARPDDDEGEVIFISAGQHYQQAFTKNVALAGNAIVLAAGEHEGLFVSPVVVVPQFNVLMIAFTQKCPDGTSIQTFVRVWTEQGPQQWRAIDREEDILLPSTANQVQYCVKMNSHNCQQSPSFSELSLTAEETTADEFFEETTGDVLPVSAPKIVERREWGSRKTKAKPSNAKINAVVVHHTGGASYKNYKGASDVQGVQRYHMDGRGWSDIGYHFLIGPDGTIYRGREENVTGAHCPPNKGRLGICVIGNYETGDELNEKNGRALLHLTTYLCGKYGLTTDRIKKHCEWRPTACPGKNIKSKFDLLKKHVENRLNKVRTQSGTTLAD